MLSGSGRARVQPGLPAALFAPSAWAASTFHGFPGGPDQALERAARLDLPMLLLQDPDAPVTRARHSEELARRNRRALLWMAPSVAPDHPDLAWKKRWSSHVAAFELFPRETTAQIIRFMDSVARATDMAREDNRHEL